MREELRRYLDGEIPLEAVPEELRGEAEAWDRLAAGFRGLGGEEGAPPGLAEEIRASVATEGRRPGSGRDLTAVLKGALAWLLRPRPVPVSPAAGLAAALGVAALVLWGAGTGSPTPPPAPGPEAGVPAGPGPRAEVRVYVEFALEAPDADEVEVLGEFNEWTPHPLSDPDGDGRWVARVPVTPGVHSYAFRVDGSRWIPDPNAERYVADGFGNRNAVLAVDPVT